mmetsp:Transcript_82942/g.209228  ORF Transcript_82942/g.209228 Transcript_82942/m.209228 type:complete len:227 (+) Transcript_82942:231-911(+)
MMVTFGVRVSPAYPTKSILVVLYCNPVTSSHWTATPLTATPSGPDAKAMMKRANSGMAVSFGTTTTNGSPLLDALTLPISASPCRTSVGEVPQKAVYDATPDSSLARLMRISPPMTPTPKSTSRNATAVGTDEGGAKSVISKVIPVSISCPSAPAVSTRKCVAPSGIGIESSSTSMVPAFEGSITHVQPEAVTEKSLAHMIVCDPAGTSTRGGSSVPECMVPITFK